MNRLISVITLFSTCSFSILLAGDVKQFGNALTLNDTTRISQILSTPEKYIDKQVLVSGLVVDVCSMRGCWIEVASDKDFESIIVKVTDGKIVFPLTAKGHNALVEGIVQKLILTEEQVLNMKKHKAGEKGLEFNPDDVNITEDDLILYRIKGLGAEIEYE